MKKIKNDPLSNYFGTRGNYCAKCWSEFTTLTEQERANLKERAKYFSSLKGKTRLVT